MSLAAAMEQVGDDLFVYPADLGLLPEMKSLGATWDAARKAWKMPACLMNARAAEELLIDVDIRDSVVVDAYDTAVSPGYDDRLFGFQKGAVDRLFGAPRGLLLCASPGLGKTAMSIVAADQVVPGDQVVVVAPAPLLRTWEREIAVWARDKTTAIVHGVDHDWDRVRDARWIVTSWDVLARHQDWFKGKWPLWIFDESVLAKSRNSQRSMAVAGGTRKRKVKADGTVVEGKHWDSLRKDIGRVWLLSGNPTTRHADDLWRQLNIIYPKAFRSFWRFAERYCIVEETPWAKVVTGTRRDRDVVADNADLILVISQEDVLDLPEYFFEAVDVDLTTKQKVAYEDMERIFMSQLDSGDVLTANFRMDQLIYLQQIASFWEGSSAKHDALVELVKSGAYEAPMLIWTHWREGAERLAERLGAIIPTAHVYGGMTAADKDDAIESYKKGGVKALVLSLGVGKFGHTLTNSKTVFYVDKTWLADDYYQSLRRVRRIGLTHRPVVVTLRAPRTVDQLVEMNLSGKIPNLARVSNANLKELIAGLGRG